MSVLRATAACSPILIRREAQKQCCSERALACVLRLGEPGDRQDLLDVSPLLQDAGAAIVDDSFLRCFQSASSDPWNWNIYLFPLWLVGLLVRHLILFPIRCAAAHCPFLLCHRDCRVLTGGAPWARARFVVLMGGFLIFFILFFSVHNLFKVRLRPLCWPPRQKACRRQAEGPGSRRGTRGGRSGSAPLCSSCASCL